MDNVNKIHYTIILTSKSEHEQNLFHHVSSALISLTSSSSSLERGQRLATDIGSIFGNSIKIVPENNILMILYLFQ